ncbi:MAG: BREX-3 system phosphatase PglZ [Deltaproteobacteria bacterium]|nr:BREX-3 system phosphatase PglZ [Deltaproteobacteria bacterium]
MTTWRESVLQQFTPEVARLTLVADPDGLLLDEGISQGIRERGFDIIEFDDHVAFRYAYESKYRGAWDRGEATDLVVVLRSGFADLASLPYDLLQAGRRLAFSLGELFPNLCTWVVAALNPADLDNLWAAQAQYTPGSLGENATKDFVLRHVFEVAPELITKPSDLLRVLLRRHYRQVQIPAVFDSRLISLLRQAGHFGTWPLDRIVSDRATFFRFLQERWPAFVGSLRSGQKGVSEPTPRYDVELDGPMLLPFDHDDVRVYVDNLFAEGLLTPIDHPAAPALRGHWAGAGLISDPTGDAARRLGNLLGAIRETLPGDEARHHEWLSFALRWAQLKLVAHGIPGEALAGHEQGLAELTSLAESAFLSWVLKRYAGLHSQPARPPVMVHHVARALAFERDESGAKIALVVVDGLAMDQWLALRAALLVRDPAWRFTDGAAFAWIPTLTSVSRQSIFAGRAPLYFPGSILTTDKEAQLWTQFWADHGLGPADVGYLKSLGELSSLPRVRDTLSRPGFKVVGLVVDTVDRIMHGMELGSRGMHGQIRQWVEEGFLAGLFALLLGSGFRVFLTSDHGNMEAVGCGRPAEGTLADVRGERARIYSAPALREITAGKFPSATVWPGAGLPQGVHALLAPPGRAFTTEGQRVVAHGGISIAEVIVPFVEIERCGT